MLGLGLDLGKLGIIWAIERVDDHTNTYYWWKIDCWPIPSVYLLKYWVDELYTKKYRLDCTPLYSN